MSILLRYNSSLLLCSRKSRTFSSQMQLNFLSQKLIRRTLLWVPSFSQSRTSTKKDTSLLQYAASSSTAGKGKLPSRVPNNMQCYANPNSFPGLVQLFWLLPPVKMGWAYEDGFPSSSVPGIPEKDRSSFFGSGSATVSRAPPSALIYLAPIPIQ